MAFLRKVFFAGTESPSDFPGRDPRLSWASSEGRVIKPGSRDKPDSRKQKGEDGPFGRKSVSVKRLEKFSSAESPKILTLLHRSSFCGSFFLTAPAATCLSKRNRAESAESSRVLTFAQELFIGLQAWRTKL